MESAVAVQTNGLLVVLSDEVINFGDELFDTAEGAAANRFVGDQREEAFDHVQPRLRSAHCTRVSFNKLGWRRTRACRPKSSLVGGKLESSCCGSLPAREMVTRG